MAIQYKKECLQHVYYAFGSFMIIKRIHFFGMHRKEQYCYHNAKSFAIWNLMFWNDTCYISNSMAVITTYAPFYVF
jgi:hypothetical protein